MKTYSVNVTLRAEPDLSGIVEYLQHQLASSSAALRFLDDFEGLVGSLEETPTVFPLVRDELLAHVGYRWAWVSSYMAFFTIDEDALVVNVERVLHGTRNWKAIVGAEGAGPGESLGDS